MVKFKIVANTFSMLMLSCFVWVISSHNNANASVSGPVVYDEQQQQIFTAQGDALVGVDFFLDIYDLQNMQENEADFEGYFKHLIQSSGANTIRVAPWIKYWEFSQEGTNGYDQHLEELTFALDRAVQWSNEAGVYLTISYGPIEDFDKAIQFWEIFASRYSHQQNIIIENGMQGRVSSQARLLGNLQESIQDIAPNMHQIYTFPERWHRSRYISGFLANGSIDFGARVDTASAVADYVLNRRPEIDYAVKVTLPTDTSNRWDSVSGMRLNTPVNIDDFSKLSFEVKSDNAQSFWVYLRTEGNADVANHFNTFSQQDWTTVELNASDFGIASFADVASIQFFIGNDANFDNHNGNNFYFDNLVFESTDGTTQVNPGFVFEDGQGWLDVGYNQTSQAITREEADTPVIVGYAIKSTTRLECCPGNRWNSVAGMTFEFPFDSAEFADITFDVKAEQSQGYWVYIRDENGNDLYNHFNTYATQDWQTVSLDINDFNLAGAGQVSSVQFFIGTDVNSDSFETNSFYFDNVVVNSTNGEQQGERGTTDAQGTGWYDVGYGMTNEVVERNESPTGPAGPREVIYNIEYTRTGGTNYYVSPNGDDNNDGLSEQTPFRTPQVGANMLGAGDTLMLMPGYYETGVYGTMIDLTASGTPANWISIEALIPGTVEFKVRGNYGVVINGGAYVRVKGLIIEGLANTLTPEEATALKDENWYAEGLVGVGIGTETRELDGEFLFPHHVIFEDNKVSFMSGGGIGTKRADYILIRNNVVHNNGYYSVWAQSGISVWENSNFDDDTEAYRTVITGNVSYENYNYFKFEASNDPNIADSFTDGNGIIIDALAIDQGFLNDGLEGVYSGHTLVENNIVYGNGGKGINLYASDNIDIIHNVSYQNGTHPEIDGEIALGQVANVRMYNNIVDVDANESVFFAYLTSNIDVSHNLIVKEGGLDGSANLADNTVEASPMFNDATNYDFGLQIQSPAIDAGTDLIKSFVDKNGVPRPQGLAVDIGAYEY